jgi:Flp pilus assembly protein TadD
LPRNNYKGAIEDFTLALKYNPKDAHAYQCRGDAREKLGDSKGASDDHNQAAMREPLYAMTAVMKGLVKTK